MIEKSEIDDKSEELGVHASHVQRDYVFGWVLAGLFRSSNSLAARLSLKGGNAFRKAYFENARYSNDLDFSIQAELSEDELKNSIVDACAFAGEQSGVDFQVAEPRIDSRQSIDDDGKLYEARVYFRSFYGEDSMTIRANLDIKEFDKIILPIQERPLIHSYSDAHLCSASVQCHKLEELLASKLVALLQRRHSLDLFDFVHSVFFQKSLSVDRLQIITTFLKKTIYEPTPHAARGLLLDLPFAVLRGFWQEYIVCPKTNLISFDDAEQGFKTVIAELFGLLAPQPTYAGAAAFAGGGSTYYVGDVRNAIMEGGRLQRILKLVYDGYERRVEPYALAFKRRKDGVGQEYFYGWDLTGGKSGQVGIKSFLANRVTSARVTEEAFDPKFPIELTKSDVGHFTRATFSSSRPRVARPHSVSSGASYTVQCPFCSKQFKRNRPDTKLNEHKNQFGSRCFGRIGFVVSVG